MNMHVALQRSLPDIVEEYDTKKANLEAALDTYRRAGEHLKSAATVAGVYGNTSVIEEHRLPYLSTLEGSLLKSAWNHVYTGLNIELIASADDKRKWRMAIENPPEFTLDNIRGTFGHYIKDPRGSILRGLAEVFCSLDPFYKSHDRVKIGVEGLPKRVIIESVGGWGSYGREKVQAMLNALAQYQGKPLIAGSELQPLDDLHRWDGHRAGVVEIQYPLPSINGEEPLYRSRGVTIKKHKNGNAHIHFDRDTLTDINKALAEFYGVVIGDRTGDKPDEPRESKEVAKDLQFIATPEKLVEDILDHHFGRDLDGKLILEPSCGDGRIMEGLRKRGATPFGVEVDGVRASQCRSKGFKVMQANFLQTRPEQRFDGVVMNPPFYGKHYAKHVRHALQFVKPGGFLIAILPITARYDHGALDDLVPKDRGYSSPWRDLPVGSFSASGTNVNTTVLCIHVPETKEN